MNEIKELLQRYQPDTEVYLQFLKVPVLVRTNSEDLATRLRAYYSPWVRNEVDDGSYLLYAFEGKASVDEKRLQDVPRRPGKLTKEASYQTEGGKVILKKRTGVVIYQRNTERYIVGNLLEHLNQVVNQINDIFVERYLQDGYLLIHGSAVVNENGLGVVFSCESGLGKSTMAVTLLEYGLRFMSNDRVLVKASGDHFELVGLPKKPRINPGTILSVPSLHHILSSDEHVFYSSLSRDELWHIEHKFDVEVNDLFGSDTFVLQGKLDSVFLLNWHRNGSGLSMASIPLEQRSQMLRPHVLNLDIHRRYSRNVTVMETEFDRLCTGVPFHNVTGGVEIAGLGQIITSRLAGSNSTT